MELSIETASRNLMVKIAGDIDHHVADHVREKIEKEFGRSNCKNIIFDFSQVDFMDSSGIGMVIGRYKTLEKQGGKVVVCCMNDSVQRIFEISGLFKIIKDYHTVDEAIKALQ